MLFNHISGSKCILRLILHSNQWTAFSNVCQNIPVSLTVYSQEFSSEFYYPTAKRQSQRMFGAMVKVLIETFTYGTQNAKDEKDI